MKNRNPLFVAGFPYVLFLIGYFSIRVLATTTGESDELSGRAAWTLLGAVLIALIGLGYSFYWLIDTAKVLRRTTNEKIPIALLLIIPFANYWWMWRYSAAVEKYTHDKAQTALSFVLLVLVGSIGMGILQDMYNKLPQNQPDQPMEPPEDNLG